MAHRFATSKKKLRLTPMSQINVTPFVDVMLVLLIIFMVTAPLLTVGVPVDLPKTEAASLETNDEPLVISVNKKGEVFVQEMKIPLKDLVGKLQSITKQNKKAKIFVKGDQEISYGKVMTVMGHISAAGYTHVSLLAETPRIEASGRKR